MNTQHDIQFSNAHFQITQNLLRTSTEIIPIASIRSARIKDRIHTKRIDHSRWLDLIISLIGLGIALAVFWWLFELVTSFGRPKEIGLNLPTFLSVGAILILFIGLIVACDKLDYLPKRFFRTDYREGILIVVCDDGEKELMALPWFEYEEQLKVGLDAISRAIESERAPRI
jgi:hypothetical protein